MQKQVRQRELRSLFELQEELDSRCKAVRQRLERGATVESGPYSARSEGDDPAFAVRCSGLNVCGLDVQRSRLAGAA